MERSVDDDQRRVCNGELAGSRFPLRHDTAPRKLNRPLNYFGEIEQAWCSPTYITSMNVPSGVISKSTVACRDRLHNRYMIDLKTYINARTIDHL